MILLQNAILFLSFTILFGCNVLIVNHIYAVLSLSQRENTLGQFAQT